MENRTLIKEKLQESFSSVLPITLIVLAICFTIAPVSVDVMLSFLIGAVMLIVGMGLFTIGAETAMTPIGNRIGARMTKTKNLAVILGLSVILGIAITISEPDLQVLANNVPHIDTSVLIIVVAVGVGVFLMLAMLRTILGIPLKWMLLVSYIAVFIMAAFSDPEFLSVAFDSGGVTTGPMTVPFILALGVGVSAIRSDKNAEADSFGMVALCSVGPIIAVMLLGFIYTGDVPDSAITTVETVETTVAMTKSYLSQIPHYLYEVAVALAPIAGFFFVFQVIWLKIRKQPFLRICVGILYTYVGLVLFLTGVNVGFSTMGTILGQTLVDGWTKYLLIPLAMLMGWYTISAEPAVHVLNKQVEEVSAGNISSRSMGISLSIAVSLAMGLSMVRVLTGISILWFLVPGYLIALVLMFFVPSIFTGIAFDSGGVASGPMAATFMLPFAMGASSALGGNVMSDAFGLVAMVAMMPLITIQIMGVIYKMKIRKAEAAELAEAYDDLDIIELWG